MAYTIQQLIDEARIPLNDADKDRYSDPLLLSYVNDALLLCKKNRPDLFLGRFSTVTVPVTLASNFPVSEMYYPLFKDYVTGRAETIDDEHTENSRAVAFIQNFMMGLRG